MHRILALIEFLFPNALILATDLYPFYLLVSIHWEIYIQAGILRNTFFECVFQNELSIFYDGTEIGLR